VFETLANRQWKVEIGIKTAAYADYIDEMPGVALFT
jgi:hypothetical protein